MNNNEITLKNNVEIYMVYWYFYKLIIFNINLYGFVSLSLQIHCSGGC